MSQRPYIILGEACESDSEEEIDFSSSLQDQKIQNCRGKIVNGEAAESDDEYPGLVSLSRYDDLIYTIKRPPHSKKGKKHLSILARKLNEKNASLQRNVFEFTKEITNGAELELNGMNQRLLRCQVQIQEGAEFLKVFNSNLSLIDSTIQSCLNMNYLPKLLA